MIGSKPPGLSRDHQLIAILWPSFLTAIAATGVFFSAFDPSELTPFNLDMDISDLAIYSIGFFVFWLIALISSFGTLYFAATNPRSPKQDEPRQ